MEEDVLQVWIRRGKVSLMGMNGIFEEISSLSMTEEKSIRKEIISRAKKKNYIPRASEASYEECLYLEYRRFLGEQVETTTPGLEILVLGQGCASCDELEQRVITALSELGLSGDVQHIRDPWRIRTYEVPGTPALVVNGVVQSVGKLLSVEEIKRILTGIR